MFFHYNGSEGWPAAPHRRRSLPFCFCSIVVNDILKNSFRITILLLWTVNPRRAMKSAFHYLIHLRKYFSCFRGIFGENLESVWNSFGVKIQTFLEVLNRINRGLADFKNYFLRHDPMCFRRHLEIFGYFACQLSVNPRGFSPHFCGLVNFNFRKEAKKLRSKLKPPTLSFFQALKSDICWILFVVSQIVLELQSRQQIRMLFRGYSKSCEDWHCPDLCARLQFALCIQFFEVFRVGIISVISWRMNNEL